jgi:hypothetical protein
MRAVKSRDGSWNQSQSERGPHRNRQASGVGCFDIGRDLMDLVDRDECLLHFLKQQARFGCRRKPAPRTVETGQA